jgi:hypothetical protein
MHSEYMNKKNVQIYIKKYLNLKKKRYNKAYLQIDSTLSLAGVKLLASGREILTY